LVDPYQVLEARAAGAGGVLVILRMLTRPRIESLLDVGGEYGMFRAAGGFRRRRT